MRFSSTLGGLSDEHQMLRDMVKKYVNEELKPDARELDRQHKFPTEHVRWLGENGLMGVSVSQERGGSGMDYLAYAIAVEEISRGCASCGVIMSVNNVGGGVLREA